MFSVELLMFQTVNETIAHLSLSCVAPLVLQTVTDDTIPVADAVFV